MKSGGRKAAAFAFDFLIFGIVSASYCNQEGNDQSEAMMILPSRTLVEDGFVAACAIWGTPAQVLENAGQFLVFDSPRAGGKYWISSDAIGLVGSRTDYAKRLLTTWI